MGVVEGECWVLDIALRGTLLLIMSAYPFADEYAISEACCETIDIGNKT
jgi:hypothetical protein